MNVVRAKHAGACYGVQRALDMAYAAILDGEDTHTLGPLIHNPKVVSELEARGVRVAQRVEDVDAGARRRPQPRRDARSAPGARRARPGGHRRHLPARRPRAEGGGRPGAALRTGGGRGGGGPSRGRRARGLRARGGRAGARRHGSRARAGRPCCARGRGRADHADTRGARRGGVGARGPRHRARGEEHHLLRHAPAPGGCGGIGGPGGRHRGRRGAQLVQHDAPGRHLRRLLRAHPPRGSARRAGPRVVRAAARPWA